MNLTAEQEAEIAHRAWRAAMGSEDRDGNPLYPWFQLPAPVKRAWKAAVTGAMDQAANSAARGPAPRLSEGAKP
jgi:hypothetical protein